MDPDDPRYDPTFGEMPNTAALIDDHLPDPQQTKVDLGKVPEDVVHRD